MSTIGVDNIKPSAGGTAFSTRGVAKAWVNFNGTGTLAVRDSDNVSSVTDNGVGHYTVNFTNAYALGDYALTATSQGGNISGAYDASAVLAGSVTILSWYASAYSDVENMSAVTHGDLA